VAKLPSQFNRAFDLSTLKEPTPVEPGKVLEATERIFIEQLIPLSKKKPVILLLWTPRSAESVALAEVLTALAERSSGSWQFAKVNADTEPGIVEALRATALPMTIALIGGQVAPLFDGVVPPEQLVELIAKVIELAKKQGVGSSGKSNGVDGAGGADGVDGGFEEPEITAAYGALAVNDLERARSEFEKLLARKPSDKDAVQGLANVQLLERISGYDASEVMAQATITSDDVVIQQRAADFEFLSGDIKGAFARLIRMVQLTSGDTRERVRLQVISLFAMLESDDPELITARSALARALF
jgi:putative thioredoxin